MIHKHERGDPTVAIPLAIHYYEANVVTPLKRRGQTPALDDYHRQAWWLFLNGRPSNPKARPFIFRSEPIDGQLWMYTIRSRESFPGSRVRRLDIAAKQTVVIDWLWAAEARRQGKSFTPPSSQWPDRITQLLASAGLTLIDEPSINVWGRISRKPRSRDGVQLTDVRVTTRVDDPERLADAYLAGIGRKKGYGAGMIRLNPDLSVPANG